MDRMPPEHIRELAAKWIDGTITDEEKDRFNEWYSALNLEDPASSDEQAFTADLRQQIKRRLDYSIDQPETAPGTAHTWSWLKAAAAAVLVCVATYTFYILNRKDPAKSAIAVTAPRPIVPGGNKAVLTLADGSAITLDSAGNGLIATQNDIEVRKAANGQLVYSGAGRKSAHSTVAYNTISIPKGGQYRLLLPDGTKVWLNAASSLRYPTAFMGAERRVSLSGEAYFEVAQNRSKPFFVEASGQEVRVLGTHFNVASYPDEAAIKTTLLEGSVRISAGTGNVLLVPGQQAGYRRDAGKLSVSLADTSAAVAWKNGYFQFRNEPIESIMKKVARWYDVDVHFEPGYSKKGLTGYVSRFENVTAVLKMLELTDIVNFKVEGRRITVMP